MVKYNEIRIVTTFIYLIEVALSIIFVFQYDRFPKMVTFGIVCYLILSVLLLDSFYRQEVVSHECYTKIQLGFLVVVSVIMSYVFHSQIILYFVMFVNSFCIYVYLDQTLSRLQMGANILVLVVMGLLNYPGLQDVALSRADSIAGFIALISINWIETTGTGMMRFYIQKNMDQEQSLDDLLKVVELKCDEAEKMAKSRSEFLENVSYEIRTPVNMMLDKTRKIINEEKEPEIAEYAGDVDHSGQTLLSMVNYILDLSKIELGKVEVIPGKYQLSSVVCDLHDRMKPKAEEKGLEFHIMYNHQMPSQFYADEMKLRQVISILTSNAIECSDSGSVGIEIDYEKYDNEDSLPKQEKDGVASSGKEWLGKQVLLLFRVTDTGRGIQEHDKAKLYQEFAHENGKNNLLYSETGLGLTISSQLVSMMEGEIGFENNAGGGSVFWIKIPQYVISFQPIGEIELDEENNS